MWRGDGRGQSESLGSLLLVAVFLTSTAAVGAYAVPTFLDQQQPDDPLADIEIEAVDGNAELTHAGGEPLDTASVDIITRNGGEQRGSLEDRTDKTLGDTFSAGEWAMLDGGVGETTVIVVDTDSNAVIAEETLQLPSGFQVDILNLDGGAVGDDLTVDYAVQNVDPEEDTQEITLTIVDADGDPIVDEAVATETLDADETATGSESYEITDDYPPAVDVTVASDDDSVTESVDIEDAPDPEGEIDVESPIFDGQGEFEVTYEFEHLESAFLRVENEDGDEFELNVDDPDGSGTEDVDADDVAPIADETITATLFEADGGPELATDSTTVTATGDLTIQPDIHAGMESFEVSLNVGTDGTLVVDHDGSEYETSADGGETVTIDAADVGGLTADEDVSATFYESDERDVEIASDSTEVREPERPTLSELSITDDSYTVVVWNSASYTVTYDVDDPDDQLDIVSATFANVDTEESSEDTSPAAEGDLSYSSSGLRPFGPYQDDYQITIRLYDEQGEVDAERVVIEDTADGDDPEIPE